MNSFLQQRARLGLGAAIVAVYVVLRISLSGRGVFL